MRNRWSSSARLRSEMSRQYPVKIGEPAADTRVIVSSTGHCQPHYNASKGGALMLTKALAAFMAANMSLAMEDTDKIIEVLAAAVPIDAIFLGKLFAMLAMSLLGIAVWTAAGAATIALVTGQSLNALPAPAVGWPAFLALGIVYFMMSYLLLGAVFLGIGGQASTARDFLQARTARPQRARRRDFTVGGARAGPAQA